MNRPRSSLRRAAVGAVLAGAGTLAFAPLAAAEITGSAVGGNGVPLSSAAVEVRDAAGNTRTVYTDSRGRFTVRNAEIARLTGGAPFTLTAALDDRCLPGGVQRRVQSAPVAVGDGAAGVALGIPVRAFCGVSFRPSGAPEATAHVDPTTGTVIARPGGIAHLAVTVPSAVRGVTVALPDGTPLGSSPDGRSVTITTPPTPYDGPMWVITTVDGASTGYPLGTLRSVQGSRPVPAPGRFDLAAIIDVSGSMGGADRGNRRLDATHLLIELASPGDRLLATGFDNEYRPIFPRTVVSNANRAALRAAARRGIKNLGGTDYNAGFDNAYAQLTADPARITVPKAAIFLTDGGHNSGAYENGHLRFAMNPSGASWPVCVVQLGRSFSTEDVARLRRIAGETGGQYLRAPGNAQLESLYFQCRGTAAGARTLVRRTQGFTVGQTRTYRSRVRPKQTRATFFVSWTEGRYRLALHQPGRTAPYVRSAGKRVRLVKGRTFQYVQVTAPRPGIWRLQVTRLASGDRVEQATTTVNVQPRR